MTAKNGVTGAAKPDSTKFGAMRSLPDLHRMRAFLVVAAELNYHRAAVELNMTQSPLSRLIIKLESEIGVRLFVRSRRGVRLTRAGDRLVSGAGTILELTAALVAEVREAHRDDEARRSRRQGYAVRRSIAFATASRVRRL